MNLKECSLDFIIDGVKNGKITKADFIDSGICPQFLHFQILTVKNVPPFVSELFFEDIFNYPDVRASIGIQECITQEELIRWVNSQYQFLLTDRNTTKKLSDATELDTQKENFQALMQDIKNGDKKIKEVSLILIVEGDKKHR